MQGIYQNISYCVKKHNVVYRDKKIITSHVVVVSCTMTA